VCLMPTTIIACKECKNTNLINIDYGLYCPKCDKNIELHDVIFFQIPYDMNPILDNDRTTEVGIATED